MNTLVLGGYGNFGERICRALASDPGIRLFVGGRNADRARGLAAQLPAAVGVAVDHTCPAFGEELPRLGVGLLIHTAGPFQSQGYEVAHAAAAAGAHYIDLADGRRFVCDFGDRMNPAFRSAGRCAITGASTVPALSSAVVDELTRHWERIDSIEVCIAPAQGAPRGLATLAAVLSYAGAPIRVWMQGRWQQRTGWGGLRTIRFRRMRPRLGALCDIPDLELFPAVYRVKQSVVFRAALEVGLAQLGFAAIAALRRIGLIRRPERLALALLNAGRRLDGFGTGLGGMVVRVGGLDGQGACVQRSWHIVAGDNRGPEIPCMPAILLARRLAAGQGPPPGAYTPVHLLRLADFEVEFNRWAMRTDVVDEPTGRATA